MNINIVGFEDAHGRTSKKSGKPLDGAFVYFTVANGSVKLVGLSCDSVFISDSICKTSDLKIGPAQIFYNRSGFVYSLLIGK